MMCRNNGKISLKDKFIHIWYSTNLLGKKITKKATTKYITNKDKDKSFKSTWGKMILYIQENNNLNDYWSTVEGKM